MKPSVLLLSVALLLTSCDVFKRGEYTPLYLQPESPLDPPGTAEARAKMRAERVKEGIFAVGATPEVQQGKAFLLDRNPDYTKDPSGRMVETKTVKVISCEGMYYFVEAEDGKRGFLRESDMVNPVTLVSTTELIPLPGEGILPDGAAVLPFEPAPTENSEQQLRMNEDGRTVVIVGKKSEKADQFEAMKRALESGQSLDGAENKAPQAPAEEEEFEDLPEPSGSANM
ncbi:MAG: hypothetical protein IKZ13_00220 [Akkermansia sp.]|nr:hypothetical protein [Akkermansia sp.]